MAVSANASIFENELELVLAGPLQRAYLLCERKI